MHKRKTSTMSETLRQQVRIVYNLLTLAHRWVKSVDYFIKIIRVGHGIIPEIILRTNISFMQLYPAYTIRERANHAENRGWVLMIY